MKYVKLFENFEYGEPQIEDYVYCNIYSIDKKEENFINNNIGQYRLINPNYPSLSKNKYMIYYDNPPKNVLPSKRISMSRVEILTFAPTIDELKVKMKEIKYNI